MIFIFIYIDGGCHGEETVLRPEQPATDHKDKDPLHHFIYMLSKLHIENRTT
jgi:hypothetical protein